jgi:hypothetical protein
MIAAAEANQLGYGGVSLVSRACGLSRVTITKEASINKVYNSVEPSGWMM